MTSQPVTCALFQYCLMAKLSNWLMVCLMAVNHHDAKINNLQHNFQMLYLSVTCFSHAITEMHPKLPPCPTQRPAPSAAPSASCYPNILLFLPTPMIHWFPLFHQCHSTPTQLSEIVLPKPMSWPICYQMSFHMTTLWHNWIWTYPKLSILTLYSATYQIPTVSLTSPDIVLVLHCLVEHNYHPL